MSDPENSIMLSSHIIDFEPLSTICLPHNKGAVLRGSLGNRLKNLVCRNTHHNISDISCLSDCCLSSGCVYLYLFETPLPPGSRRMPKSGGIPRPFLIAPPVDGKTTYHRGETLQVGIVLLGGATVHINLFVRAFEQMGKDGIGDGNGRFKVAGIHQKPLRQQAANLHVSSITLSFLTPTQIRVRKKNVTRPDFLVFFKTLLRRIENLAEFYGTPNLTDTNNREELLKKAADIKTVNSSLTWVPQVRKSSRHGCDIPQDGFTGSLAFSGDITPFMPYIVMGETLHVGKSITSGMGKYEIQQ